MKVVATLSLCLVASRCWAATETPVAPEGALDAALAAVPEAPESEAPSDAPVSEIAPASQATTTEAVRVSSLMMPPKAESNPSRVSRGLVTSSGFEVDYSLRRTLEGRRLSSEGVRGPNMVLSTWGSRGDNTFFLTGDVSMASGNRSGEGRLRETSVFAIRTLRRGNIKIEPGLYFYARDREFGPSTAEAGLSISRRTGALRWFADGYIDVAQSRGDYLLQAGLSHRFSPDDKSLIKTSLMLGRTSERVDSGFARLTDTSNYASLTLSCTRDITPHLAIRPHLEATRFFSSGSGTFLKFGVGLQWSS